MAALASYTAAQVINGVVEDVSSTTFEGKPIVIYLDENLRMLGKPLAYGYDAPPPSDVAVNTREGNLDVLGTELAHGAKIDARLQGYTGLNLAIVYGRDHVEHALIEGGADVNASESEPFPILWTITLSRQSGQRIVG
jgi:hypothetical protein